MKKYRAKQRALTTGKPTRKTNSKTNVSRADKEEDKDKEKEGDGEGEGNNKKIDCKQIADLFNSLCPSFPAVKYISDSTKQVISDSLAKYSMEDFETLFKKAEASDFLKGKNDRKWIASFDWLIRDENMAKVLNGNFDNKPNGEEEIVPDWLLRYRPVLKPKTAADDDEIRARAEALQAQLKG